MTVSVSVLGGVQVGVDLGGTERRGGIVSPFGDYRLVNFHHLTPDHRKGFPSTTIPINTPIQINHILIMNMSTLLIRDNLILRLYHLDLITFILYMDDRFSLSDGDVTGDLVAL